MYFHILALFISVFVCFEVSGKGTVFSCVGEYCMKRTTPMTKTLEDDDSNRQYIICSWVHACLQYQLGSQFFSGTGIWRKINCSQIKNVIFSLCNTYLTNCDIKQVHWCNVSLFCPILSFSNMPRVSYLRNKFTLLFNMHFIKGGNYNLCIYHRFLQWFYLVYLKVHQIKIRGFSYSVLG